jgi:tRNA(fMet)-specific endonuclease VapC
VPDRLVLDTSAYSHLRANHAAVLDQVAAAEVVHLPTIVLGELEAGFRLGRRTEENRVALSEFLSESFVVVLAVTPDVARRYGRIFADLRRAGTPIPVNDIWIAACALDAGAHLLTFDRDFEQVRQLDCTVLS